MSQNSTLFCRKIAPRLMQTIDSSHSIAADYRRDGVVRVKGFLSPDVVADLKRRLEEFVREVVPRMAEGDRTFEPDGKTVRNIWRIDQYDPYFRELAYRPETIEFISALVNG